MVKFIISNRSSQLINVLKCLCCIGVVSLHSSFSSIKVGSQELVVDGWGWDIFVDVFYIIFRSLVPLFFFVSGYLFFLNYEKFSLPWFIKKLKKRIRTLLIPYLCGILLVYIFFNVSGIFLKGIMSSGSSHDYNPLTMFWHPLPNAVLWFLRDLMVVMLLSPIVIRIMEWTRWSVLILIFVLWLTDIWRFQLPGLSSISFLFFYIGAFFSFYKIDFIVKLCSLNTFVLTLIPLLFGVFVITAYLFQSEYLTKLSIFLGMPTIVIISNMCMTPQYLSRINFGFWMPATFFVYAYHVMIEVIIKKTLFTVIHPNNAIWNYVIYFITVFLCVVFLCAVYYIISKYLPKIAALLTGR